jgi:hypothetical protein
MGCRRSYAQLFAPLEAAVGPIGPETVTAVMG